jgi:hypothetical protein
VIERRLPDGFPIDWIVPAEIARSLLVLGA